MIHLGRQMLAVLTGNFSVDDVDPLSFLGSGFVLVWIDCLLSVQEFGFVLFFLLLFLLLVAIVQETQLCSDRLKHVAR
jgi:hypothetical protein